MNNGELLLEARQLNVAIGGRDICAALDFQLRGGEQLAILGRNGAGKSTLLSTLAGLRAPQGGQISLAGQDLFAMAPRQAARLRGWLGQYPADPFASSVLDTALTGRHPHLARWDWESASDLDIARDALKAMALNGFEQRNTQSLSGGERQRAAIATLLTQQPRLYLLDEPLAHLDLNHQIAVLDLFATKARNENIAVIMVLHDPGLALRYCDKALLLHGDGCAEFGNSRDILDEARLSSLYGHPLRRATVDDATGATTFVPL